MPVKFTNNSSTTLSADIAADATSVTVESVTGFPSVANTDFFFATLEREADANTKEVVKVTALSTKTYTIDRSISTSATFSAGDKFEVRMTAEGLQDPSLLQAGITTNTLTVDAGSSTTDLTVSSSTSAARLNVTSTATSNTQHGVIEIGGVGGGHIDIKKPFSDDYDLRLQHFNDDGSVLLGKTGDMIVRAETNGTAVKLQHEGANTKLETTDTGIDVTGEVKGDSLDIDGNAAITGTVTIDPPLVTSEAGGLGAKGIIMKKADLRMKVDGDHDANGSGSKGTNNQTNSRIIFDSEQHEHEEHETLGFRNPAFVIQANYNHNADNATHSTTAGEQYLDANISQLGLGNLTISSGKLQLRGKLESADDGGTNDEAASDDYISAESFIGLSIDGAATNGTLTNLHFGRINNSTQNIRLQPSAGGIIVEGMGSAGTGTTTKTNSGTIGTFNDEDLLTLAQNQVTVAGELEATSLDINGAADISGDLTLSAGGDGALTFGAASSIKVIDNSATALVIEEANTAYMTFNTANSGGEKIEFGKPIHGTLTGDVTGNVTGNTSGSSGSCTGNAATATVLATARNIGGVSFNGSASIDLPGVNAAGNQSTTGNAATATIAKGAAVIHNQSTDGATIGHADVAGYVGKTVIYTNTGDGNDLTLGVPQCPEDVAIGEQIHLVNASTGSGSTANIVFDLDEVSGDAQNINICTGASVVDVGTTNPHIIAGGVATLVAVAANEYILFGSGVVDN